VASLIEEGAEPSSLWLNLRNWVGQHPDESRDWGHWRGRLLRLDRSYRYWEGTYTV